MKRATLHLVLAGAAVCGCVEREMIVTSEPAGALVFISDREVGRTPVTQPFTWYGDYDIVLRKEGSETLETHANLLPPWYELPPLDLLSALAPWTYHDRRYLHYELKPLSLPDDEQLLRSARELRERAAEPVK